MLTQGTTEANEGAGNRAGFLAQARAKQFDIFLTVATTLMMGRAVDVIASFRWSLLASAAMLVAVGLLLVTGANGVLRVAAGCLLVVTIGLVAIDLRGGDQLQTAPTTTAGANAAPPPAVDAPTSSASTPETSGATPSEPTSTSSDSAARVSQPSSTGLRSTPSTPATRPPVASDPTTPITAAPPAVAEPTTPPAVPTTEAPSQPTTTVLSTVATAAATTTSVPTTPVTCAIAINTLPLPTSACDGRVSITTFGSPPNKPSAWTLQHATVELNRNGIVAYVGPPTAEACYWTNQDVQAKTADYGDGTYWMADAAHRLLIEGAPSGTTIVLYADCFDGPAGADTSRGWNVVVS